MPKHTRRKPARWSQSPDPVQHCYRMLRIALAVNRDQHRALVEMVAMHKRLTVVMDAALRDALRRLRKEVQREAQ